MTLNDRIAKSDGSIEANTGSEVLIMRVDSGCYFSMDGVAKGIWAAIDGPTPIRQIIDEQIKAYDSDSQLTESETLAFLSDLLEHKLIERVEGGDLQR